MNAKRLVALVALVALAGCERLSYVPDWGADQCMRRDLFHTCLKVLPAGPKSTQYNDWDEVVARCEDAAYRQSLRKLAHIKPECQI